MNEHHKVIIRRIVAHFANHENPSQEILVENIETVVKQAFAYGVRFGMAGWKGSGGGFDGQIANYLIAEFDDYMAEPT